MELTASYQTSWPEHGWTAAGYRVHPGGSPIPIRPSTPLYGLGPEFDGGRLLGTLALRPDMRREDPRNTVDYVELHHFVDTDEAGPFVLVRSTVHRPGTPRPPAGVRGIGVGPLTLEETEFQASFWLASRTQRADDGSASEPLEVLESVERAEWRVASVLFDGGSHPFHVRQLNAAWCAVGDFGDHSVAVMGEGLDPRSYSLVRVEVVAALRDGHQGGSTR